MNESNDRLNECITNYHVNKMSKIHARTQTHNKDKEEFLEFVIFCPLDFCV